MPRLPDMTKHRGFPSGLPGTGLQFTIRRANPKGVARIFERARNRDRAEVEKLADTAFLHALWQIADRHLDTFRQEQPHDDGGLLPVCKLSRCRQVCKGCGHGAAPFWAGNKKKGQALKARPVNP